MGWLSEGDPPPHPCGPPPMLPLSNDRPELGFVIRRSDDDSGPRREVYAGARWQCDICETIWTLNDDGEWEREHGGE